MKARSERAAVTTVAAVIVVVIILAAAVVGTIALTRTSGTTTVTSVATSTATTTATSVATSIATTTATSIATTTATLTSSSTSLVCSSSSIASSATPSTLTTLVYGYPAPDLSTTGAAYVAQSLGYFGQLGLSINIELVTPFAMAPGMAAGSLQVTDNPAEDLYLNAASGIPLSAITYGDNGSPEALFVPSSITTPSQLVGKTIALGAIPGAPPEVGLRYILGAMGLSEANVSLTYISSFTVIIDSLEGGKVAAAVLQPPYDSIVTAAGYHQLGIWSTNSPEIDPTLVVMTPAFIAKNPAIVNAFVMGELEGQHAIYSINAANENTPSSQATLKALSTFLGFNTTEVFNWIQTVIKLNLANPTLVPNYADLAESFSQTAGVYPSVSAVNATSLYNFSDAQQLAAPCGFTYNLWGGSSPPV